jgi:hypothetical protein
MKHTETLGFSGDEPSRSSWASKESCLVAGWLAGFLINALKFVDAEAKAGRPLVATYFIQPLYRGPEGSNCQAHGIKITDQGIKELTKPKIPKNRSDR